MEMKENHIVSVIFNRNYLVIPNDLLPLPYPLNTLIHIIKRFPAVICEGLLVCLDIKAHHDGL